MQEDVEHRTVSLGIKAAKLTGNILKKAILKFLASQKKDNPQRRRRGRRASKK